MNSSQLDALIAWIAAHPIAAGGVIFAAAMCDALLIIGAAVPAIPIFFAVGTLVGLGTLDGSYAILCAAAGAFCGDGVSYLIGRRYGDRMRTMWPFSRYPEWLDSGAQLFQRHGLKGILIARYVGAVRPFVPAIAGMLAMPAARYSAASAVAALSWAALFIVPGWVFGASLEAISAIAGRLAILLLIVLGTLIGVGWLVARGYQLLAPRATTLLGLALAWSHQHPRWGRLSRALIDPHAPESTTLALLALLLTTAATGLLWAVLQVAGSAGQLPLDLALQSVMLELRTPLADQLMAALCSLGSWNVLLPVALLFIVLLGWRGGVLAAGHGLAALGFGLLAEQTLQWVHFADAASASVATVSATTLAIFGAIALARDLPGRRHAWPYTLAGALVTLLLIGQLYLGLERASVLLVEVGLGVIWSAALGLAFRRHVARIGDTPKLAAATVLLWLGLGTQHATQHAHALADAAQVRPAAIPLSLDDWRDGGWQRLPATRSDFTAVRSWPLNLQFAGDPIQLSAALQAAGWHPVPESGWRELFATLNSQLKAGEAPILSAAHLGQNETLLLQAPGQDERARLVLRLWPSDLVLDGEGPRILQGALGEMQFGEHLELFRTWIYRGPSDRARAAILALPAPLTVSPRQRADGSEVLLLHADSGMGVPGSNAPR